jgi:hypothetical protein
VIDIDRAQALDMSRLLGGTDMHRVIPLVVFSIALSVTVSLVATFIAKAMSQAHAKGVEGEVRT